MEYASLLAGERWSDHPSCTHPLLAAVARLANDHISDVARPGLVPLIPSVIGRTDDDPSVDARIAMRCAATALPVVAEYRQRALAVGLEAAQRVLDDLGDPASPVKDTTGLFDHAHRAVAAVPRAARWAEEFTAGHAVTPRAFQRRSAPSIVRVAVVGIAEAAIPDPDGLLFELLTTVIEDCTQRLGPDSTDDAATQDLIRAV
jgi:catechol 2,3-dioxygenase-like lactoylglutathione lyase family enzyme